MTDTNQSLKSENSILEPLVVENKSKVEKYEKQSKQLSLINAGIKDEHKFKVFAQYIKGENKEDNHDPNIIKAIVQTIVWFASDEQRRAEILQLAQMENKEEMEKTIVKIKQYWATSYFLLDNEDNPEVLENYRLLKAWEAKLSNQ